MTNTKLKRKMESIKHKLIPLIELKSLLHKQLDEYAKTAFGIDNFINQLIDVQSLDAVSVLYQNEDILCFCTYREFSSYMLLENLMCVEKYNGHSSTFLRLSVEEISKKRQKVVILMCEDENSSIINMYMNIKTLTKGTRVPMFVKHTRPKGQYSCIGKTKCKWNMFVDRAKNISYKVAFVSKPFLYGEESSEIEESNSADEEQVNDSSSKNKAVDKTTNRKGRKDKRVRKKKDDDTETSISKSPSKEQDSESTIDDILTTEGTPLNSQGNRSKRIRSTPKQYDTFVFSKSMPNIKLTS